VRAARGRRHGGSRSLLLLRSRLAPLRRPALGLLVACVLLGAAEGVLRVLVREVGQASIPSDVVAAHVAKGAMRYHADLGWTWSRVPEPSLGINSDGFRYAELPKAKPAGTLRGFTLGDSQTFGAGLDAPDSYTAVAERRLREGGHAIELVDAGVAGYGSLQALRLIESKLVEWSPDLLVIDCRTFDSATETRAPRHRGPVEAVRHVLFSSRIYYALRLGLREAGVEEGRRMVPRAGVPEEGRGEGNHALIAAFARHEGIEVVFVDYPLWANGAVVSRAPAHELPAGATVVPATAALLATGKAPAELFFDNNHLSVEGARVVGEALATTLDALLPRAAPMVE
jgi:hypothetical protein